MHHMRKTIFVLHRCKKKTKQWKTDKSCHWEHHCSDEKKLLWLRVL